MCRLKLFKRLRCTFNLDIQMYVMVAQNKQPSKNRTPLTKYSIIYFSKYSDTILAFKNKTKYKMINGCGIYAKIMYKIA